MRWKISRASWQTRAIDGNGGFCFWSRESGYSVITRGGTELTAKYQTFRRSSMGRSQKQENEVILSSGVVSWLGGEPVLKIDKRSVSRMTL